MYKHKAIEKFINKVNKLAAAEAQKVYDAHRAKLIEMIQAQLHEKDELYNAMGSSSIDREGKSIRMNVLQKFENVISTTQYPQQDYYCGFSLPDIITKTTIKD